MWSYRNDTELQMLYESVTGASPPPHFLNLVSSLVPVFERYLGYDFDKYEPTYHESLNFMLIYYIRDLVNGRMRSEKIGDYSYTRFSNDETPPEWVHYYHSLQHVGDTDV